MVTILQLPPEVVDAIYDRLSLESISRLRLVCNATRDSSHRHFLKYFNTVHVILEDKSLSTLGQISKNRDLAHAVRTVEVCSDHVSNAAHAFHVEQSADSLNSPLYSDLLKAQTALLESGRAGDVLSQALRGLPNCENIVLSDRLCLTGDALELVIGVLPERRLIRPRNGQGYPDSLVNESRTFVTEAATVVLLAAAGTALSSLQIVLGLPYNNAYDNGLTDAVTSSMLSSLRANYEVKKPDLGNITTLRLVVSVTEGSDWAHDIVQFVALFSRLTNLRLNFKSCSEEAEGLIQCMISHLDVQNWRKLELSGLHVTEKEMMDLLQRHEKSLEEVTLENIEFKTHRGWSSFLSSAKQKLPSCKFVLKQLPPFYTSHRISHPDDYARVLKIWALD